MKSEWRVAVFSSDFGQKYAIYRLLDKDGLNIPKNREFATDYMTDKGEANTIANRLNAGIKKSRPALREPDSNKRNNIY